MPIIKKLASRTVYAAVSILVAATMTAVSADAATTTSYYIRNEAEIRNPERGFYYHGLYHCNDRDFRQADFDYMSQEKITLAMCYFLLSVFKTRSLVDLDNPSDPNAPLQRLARQAALLRSAGFKMILRFAYNEEDNPNDPNYSEDASPSVVQMHLTELHNFFKHNSDVIAIAQMGFVGAWGEGFYSKNFGDRGVLTEQNKLDRKAIVDKLLAMLPDRSVQVRTPRMKSYMYVPDPRPATLQDSGPIARVGHHNDCFLLGSSDSGTFTSEPSGNDQPWSSENKRSYVEQDTQLVPSGGETCYRYSESQPVFPNYAKCSGDPSLPFDFTLHATAQMEKYHYSYLNRSYSQEVIDRWMQFNCIDEIKQKLGYRFTLLSVTTSDTVDLWTGGALPFQMTIQNTGWARTINSHEAKLVLRNASTGAKYMIPLGNTASWLAGTTVRVPVLEINKTTTFPLPVPTITVPSTVPPGTYELLIAIQDTSGSLRANPSYSIHLANVKTWESTSGLNRLHRTVTVRTFPIKH